MTDDKNNIFSKGFTLVELMVSIAVLGILFAISSIVLSTVLPSTSQSTTNDVLLSDIRAQQTQAMSNDSSYGIHFGTTSYTLFTGATFNPDDASNFVVNLDPTVRFTNILWPGSVIVFLPGSGDIAGYAAGSDSLDISNTQTNKVTTIKFNRYGATY